MMREFNFTNTPIVDIVNDIIIDSVIRNASDIHLDPAEKYLKIRIRVDGELRDYAIIDNKYKRNLTTRIKLLAGMNITESRLPQDGAIKSVIQGKDLDLRVSVLPTSFGEKVVIRILDYSMSMQGLEYLGFTNENYNIINELLKSPNGIILITGATGSGKSTTVYSMLQRLNKEETNIITVEDPVEMSIEGLNQVQVNSEIGLDFAAVLRSILRQDPNVILIGEIRDGETARIAIRASITGHLVLSTLHTNNSLTTIERLIDMDVERYLLSSSLKGIISQTLAKRLCNNCKTQREATSTEKTLYKKVLGIDVNYVYESHGCDYCHNGYTGRIALQEVLMINDEIREAINSNINRDKLRHLIYSKGAKTLLQDGLIKTLDGITDLKEVLRLVDYDESDTLFKGSDNIDYNKVKEEEISVTESPVKEEVTPVVSNPVEVTSSVDVNSNIETPVINNIDTNNTIEIPSDTGVISNSTETSDANSIEPVTNTEINNIVESPGVTTPISSASNETIILPNFNDNPVISTYNSDNVYNNTNYENVYVSNNYNKDNINDIIDYYNNPNNISGMANMNSTFDNNASSDNNVNVTPNYSTSNNLFESASGNLFDDSVFNSLRVDNNINQNINNNYTNDLLNMINNDINDA